MPEHRHGAGSQAACRPHQGRIEPDQARLDRHEHVWGGEDAVSERDAHPGSCQVEADQELIVRECENDHRSDHRRHKMPRMMALPANRALWRAVAAVVATRQDRPTTTAATLKEIKTALVQAASLNKSWNVRSDIPLGGNSSSWRGVSAMGTTTSVGSIRYTNTGAQTSASSVQSNGNPRRSPPAVAHGGAAVPTPASERSKLALPGEPLIHGHQHGDHHNDHHSQG